MSRGKLVAEEPNPNPSETPQTRSYWCTSTLYSVVYKVSENAEENLIFKLCVVVVWLFSPPKHDPGKTPSV